MTTSGAGRRPLAICYGTRPQVIKASVLVETLGARWNLLTIDTGQHYDYELNALLYQQLGIQRPHLFLEVGSADHGAQTSAILARSARAFAEHRPWGVVVIGDTNSTLGAGLAGVQSGIPLIHVEAGLRSRNRRMAEDVNRRAIDAISDVLCAPSASAEQRLRLEQSGGAIVRTGDVARDVLLRNLDRTPALAPAIGWPLEPGAPYVLATFHRAELTSDPSALAGVMAGLGQLDLPVVFPVHPRTQAALSDHGVIRPDRGLFLCPPIGYLETLSGIRGAAAVVTDSGGVQREAYWLGTPCVTVRDETEWIETLELGANVLLAPHHAERELAGLLMQRRRRADAPAGWPKDVYGAGDAAARISDAIATHIADA